MDVCQIGGNRPSSGSSSSWRPPESEENFAIWERRGMTGMRFGFLNA